MIDTKDFSFFEGQNTFDFKGFLVKILSYWKWFIVSLIVAFTIAYQVNIRRQRIYAMETTIAVKEENNPFFTSTTSLVFNWGGTSDEVQNISNSLKSRSHNELVVEKLEFYAEYLQQGKYNYEDVYGEIPFKIDIDKNKGQLEATLIGVKFLSETDYQIEVNFTKNPALLVHYIDNSKSNANVEVGKFIKRYKVGQVVSLPFLNWKLDIIDNPGPYKGKEYFIKFNDFNKVVSKYEMIKIDVDAKAGSIMTLSLQGPNKTRLVDYLNQTVNMLIKTQLDRKNQFATNTIAFIDSTLVAMGQQLKETGNELKTFNKGKNIVELEQDGSVITGQLVGYDVKKDEILRKIAYYNSLRSYLKSSVDYSRLPAPTVAGIDDPNIIRNVANLIALSTQRSELAYSVKSEKIFKEFDSQMEAIKKVLLENIGSSNNSLQYDLSLINEKIGKVEGEIRKLPEDKQEYMKILRKYDLSDNIYNSFLQKRSEAEIVKAANLSDIHFIDTAKDIGEGLIGPNTSINYILAFFLGLVIPLLVVFGIFFVENAILNTEDIGKLTKIPLIGVVGIKRTKTNLAVFEKPKSALSESFRAIRSSLQFLYKKQEIEGSKTLMLTSSISGEGKTFCSLNIATVFALSEKKTIIVGLDLRKPKIFDDFNITNDIGTVNYLIGQKSLDEIIQSTHIPYLDVITSGPIPPNPSELIIGDSMKTMMSGLKEKYDYIILDTPPVGLVSDAIELAEYADVTLYIMRQNYTKKDMVTLLNNRQKRGELNNISIIFKPNTVLATDTVMAMATVMVTVPILTATTKRIKNKHF
jgi:succinoglycan biosynthesis transport protein ExoP